jgi:transcriptional regulator with XRE-family HTH domain
MASAAHKLKTKSVADYISSQIDLCGKKQTQIAEECGFEKPNVITMIKQGKTKLPIGKIGRMAKALGVDPVFLMKMVLAEYNPDMLEAITMILTQPAITHNELEIIQVIRRAKVLDPRIATETQRRELLALVKTWEGGT